RTGGRRSYYFARRATPESAGFTGRATVHQWQLRALGSRSWSESQRFRSMFDEVGKHPGICTATSREQLAAEEALILKQCGLACSTMCPSSGVGTSRAARRPRCDRLGLELYEPGAACALRILREWGLSSMPVLRRAR